MTKPVIQIEPVERFSQSQRCIPQGPAFRVVGFTATQIPHTDVAKERIWKEESL
jgi:hypothetical protein